MAKISKQLDNAATVLRYLAANGASTQTQVVNEIKLQRTSVFNIFECLEKNGLIDQQNNVLSLQKGRPCRLWNLNGRLGGFMTVYVSNAETVMNLTDCAGNVAGTVTERSPHDFDTVLNRVTAQAATWQCQLPLLGLIMVLAGRVDFASGQVVFSRMWKLKDYPLRDILKTRLQDVNPQLLLLVENDARMAAWGQRIGGACIGLDDYLSLSIIDGRRNGESVPISIGSGVVLAGQLYRGQRGGSGELDESCYRWFGKIYADGRFPVSLQELDRKSRAYFAAKLGENFAHLVNYLAPQRMVVVFEQPPPSPDFFTTLRQEIQKKLICTDSRNFPVEIAVDGIGSVVRGAQALLRDAFFSDDRELSVLLDGRFPE